jgi:hypothetical protein
MTHRYCMESSGKMIVRHERVSGFSGVGGVSGVSGVGGVSGVSGVSELAPATRE